jgi:glycerate kinase
MASASGLQLLSKDERNPMLTTSLGAGEMIFDALSKGAKKIYLFVGGSASNDAGMGIASALGYNFKDGQNNTLKPIGKNLSKIKRIEKNKKLPFDNFEIIVLTDVENKLFGKDGAAYLYAAQKGAAEKEIIELDNGLRNFAKVVRQTFKISVENITGTGAGGGVVASILFVGKTKVKSGIETILDLLQFNEQLRKTDLVITGEGLLDKQTLEGKLVKGVMTRCRNSKKPFAIVCGNFKLTKEGLKEFNGVIIKSIKTENISIKDSMHNAYSHLVKRAEELIRQIKNQNTI